jgi:hypothetical protein
MMLFHRGALIMLVAALAGSNPSAAQDAVQKDLTEGLSADSPAADLFLRAYEVFSHPRCSNCHPRDDRPRWGPTRQVHGMNVQRGEKCPLDPPKEGDCGRVGMYCATCHQEANGELLDSPPGAHDRRLAWPLVWRLAPQTMGWAGLTAAELCMRLKSIDAAFPHIFGSEIDPLVAWAWRPGPGRESAPGTLDQFVKVLRWWKDRGEGCPSM